MNKKIIIAAVSVALLSAGTLAFADTMMEGGVTANTTTQVMTTKIQCVGAAVATREASIDSAMTSFTASSNSAYSARATALQQAYTQTTAVSVRASVKSAWMVFASSIKTARKAWQTLRTQAWTTFRAQAKVCKAPVGVSDSADASLEASGN